MRDTGTMYFSSSGTSKAVKMNPAGRGLELSSWSVLIDVSNPMVRIESLVADFTTPWEETE